MWRQSLANIHCQVILSNWWLRPSSTMASLIVTDLRHKDFCAHFQMFILMLLPQIFLSLIFQYCYLDVSIQQLKTLIMTQEYYIHTCTHIYVFIKRERKRILFESTFCRHNEQIHWSTSWEKFSSLLSSKYLSITGEIVWNRSMFLFLQTYRDDASMNQDRVLFFSVHLLKIPSPSPYETSSVSWKNL